MLGQGDKVQLKKLNRKLDRIKKSGGVIQPYDRKKLLDLEFKQTNFRGKCVLILRKVSRFFFLR